MSSFEIDANKVVEALQNRLGNLVAHYETEIAIRDAIIEQNREANIARVEAEAADEVAQ